ncbi:MAG: Fpg/Nei family DNA glycosylase [Thermoanaerobaculia bacterium]
MPELPDITLYVEHLARRVAGRELWRVRLRSPFVLRSVTPSLAEAEGKQVLDVRRLGKRILLALEGDLFLVIHLMIAGRLRWKALPRSAAIPGKVGLAAFDFDAGTLLLTEASPKKRAWIRLVRGPEALAALDPGGLEVLETDLSSFRTALTMESHTLKRVLTDPRLFSGIGNAYSDEILHGARLSPIALTRKLSDEEIARLFAASRAILIDWTDRLRRETGEAFPEKVTAFREEMAVHGRYGKPCPVCGTDVQRIVYAENETNYCPTCQTGGRLLADRSLSRLLKGDWPRTLEEMEESKEERRRPPPAAKI